MSVTENKRMPTGAKRFAYSVILAGGLIFAVAAWNWTSPNLYRFVIYFALALIVSMLKFRLPGIEGTFSPSFFFTLIGIVGFTLPETLVASCAGALVQCLWKPKQRPTIIQILFSMANLCLSIALCFLLVRSASKFGFGYRPAVIALVAAVHFFTSTMLVSGVLSLFQGKPLRHVCQQWYLWSFPYYLVGATVVGLFPFSGRVPPAEGWLILIPLLYLVHFFYVISTDRAPGAVASENHGGTLAFSAHVYLISVSIASLVLLGYGALHWEPQNLGRFFGYLSMALLAATLKVRLPGLRSTISVTFVIFLVAVVELTYPEAIFIGAAATAVQTVWKARRTPTGLQIAFNSGCMVLSVSAAYVVCRVFLASALAASFPALLAVATILLYGSNSVMVAAAICLAERKPLRRIWQQCYFWSFPYYLAGACASALMISAAESVIWQLAFAIFPIVILVYVTYRLHAKTRLLPQITV